MKYENNQQLRTNRYNLLLDAGYLEEEAITYMECNDSDHSNLDVSVDIHNITTEVS